MKNTGILLIGAGIVALLVSKKGGGDGGTSGGIESPRFEGLMGNGESQITPAGTIPGNESGPRSQNIPSPYLADMMSKKVLTPSSSEPTTLSGWTSSLPQGLTSVSVSSSYMSPGNGNFYVQGAPQTKQFPSLMVKAQVPASALTLKKSSGGGSAPSIYGGGSSGGTGSSGSFSNPAAKARVAAPAKKSTPPVSHPIATSRPNWR